MFNLDFLPNSFIFSLQSLREYLRCCDFISYAGLGIRPGDPICKHTTLSCVSSLPFASLTPVTKGQ